MTYFEKIKKYQIKENPIIMGIETSCDETAVAIIKDGREILADEIISSATEHAKFGGVVPEIASRTHTTAILTATKNALSKANMTLNDVDAFAVTYGAGLLGALPFITILASGGHTSIIAVKNYYDFEILGSTLDDAVGEAFDKVARVLGLSYPGGPNVERLANDGQNVIPLPKMLKNYNGGEFDFSYSGLKTAVINYVHNEESRGNQINKADVARSFQCSAIDDLIEKALLATKRFGYNTICVCGGVGANGYLRTALQDAVKDKNIKLILPEKRYCTDNGAMIGAEGYLQYKKGNFADLNLNASAVVPLK